RRTIFRAGTLAQTSGWKFARGGPVLPRHQHGGLAAKSRIHQNPLRLASGVDHGYSRLSTHLAVLLENSVERRPVHRLVCRRDEVERKNGSAGSRHGGRGGGRAARGRTNGGVKGLKVSRQWWVVSGRQPRTTDNPHLTAAK